ncbi:MAG: aconitase X catalytic domain-containing protein [Anaerolineales bacterium]|nr:aconitase X catalytic domain-containing protein [Anaerolineales bacterium]
MKNLKLTSEEQAMLAGEHGPAVQKAMELVTALGAIYGAEDLTQVESVQVAGVSYKNLGEAGLSFLREWAEQGARVRVPTFLNPAGMDVQRWQELGFDAEFAQQQIQVIQAFTAMGISPTCTCTPYLIGQVPKMGAHVAWAESSAVSFANSVMGARTNREGGPSALAAAISGRTARYGLHLDENRLATVKVTVKCPVKEPSDWGALGYLVGKQVRNRAPYFKGLNVEESIIGKSSILPHVTDSQISNLKALGAAMAASGAVALYHVENLTPEARARNMLHNEHGTLVIDSLEPGYKALSGDAREIDLVWLGCPHASLGEIAQLADFALGKRFKPDVWITTSRQVREAAVDAGYVEAIEAAGGQVVADTCVVVAPVGGRYRTMATLSGKGAYYAPSYLNMNVRYGSWEQLKQIMSSGFWE